MLRHYKIGDRIHSRCGPGDGCDRAPRLGRDATAEERVRFATDQEGDLVFPGSVVRLEGVEFLKVNYDGIDGQFIERFENVRPRLQMPWYPRKLDG